MKSHTTYAILWFIIGFISAVDIYWAIVLQDVLIETELNPVGRFLIEFSNGDIALFMFCKIIGLVVVLGFLVILYNYRRRIAWISILGVSIFQLWLLWYLNAAGGPSITTKVKLYRLQEQQSIKQAEPCPLTIIHVSPAEIHLKQSTDSMTLQAPVLNAEEANLPKFSTPLP